MAAQGCSGAGMNDPSVCLGQGNVLAGALKEV